MRTKSQKQQNINVVTLGCAKNTYDSEVLMGQLRVGGKAVVHESQGDIVVINTCGFIENAKAESIDTILDFVEKKKRGEVMRVFVTGCLSERYKSDLQQAIPDVDQYFGTRELPLLLKALGADYRHELVGERLLTTPQHFAYLKISEGCDRKCAFCAIPLMRGRHCSKPIEELVREARSLAAKGVKELALIAQDSTFYGLDLYKTRRLADLLRALSTVEGIEWIRLHYAFPSGFPMDVLDEIRDNPKVCTYLDIPLQHISTRLLHAMRRGTSHEKTDHLLRQIREKVPGIALRTTLIVGYPGETEEDFQALKDWVVQQRFDRLGCFTYSHEENTHAHRLADDVPAAVKQARADAIMEVQCQVSRELNRQKVGKTLKVLFDRKEGVYYVGRTEFDSPDVDNQVWVPAEQHYLSPGHFAEVKVTAAEDYDLFGEVVF